MPITHNSSKEYDDDRKPPDGHDDDSDISSRGNRSSYHFDCSANFFSNNPSGSGRSKMEQCDKINVENSECIKKHLNGELTSVMAKAHHAALEVCKQTNQLETVNEREILNDQKIIKLIDNHSLCKDSKSCPIQALKRRFRHFISSSKERNLTGCVKRSGGPCKYKGIRCSNDTA